MIVKGLIWYISGDDRLWSQWSDWDSCSVSCGGGLMKRTRTCKGPDFTGAKCIGPFEEITSCSDFDCPDSK